MQKNNGATITSVDDLVDFLNSHEQSEDFLTEEAGEMFNAEEAAEIHSEASQFHTDIDTLLDVAQQLNGVFPHLSAEECKEDRAGDMRNGQFAALITLMSIISRLGVRQSEQMDRLLRFMDRAESRAIESLEISRAVNETNQRLEKKLAELEEEGRKLDKQLGR